MKLDPKCPRSLKAFVIISDVIPTEMVSTEKQGWELRGRGRWQEGPGEPTGELHLGR